MSTIQYSIFTVTGTVKFINANIYEVFKENSDKRLLSFKSLVLQTYYNSKNLVFKH